MSPTVFDAAMNDTIPIVVDGFNFGQGNSANLTVTVCKDVDCTETLICNRFVLARMRMRVCD